MRFLGRLLGANVGGVALLVLVGAFIRSAQLWSFGAGITTVTDDYLELLLGGLFLVVLLGPLVFWLRFWPDDITRRLRDGLGPSTWHPALRFVLGFLLVAAMAYTYAWLTGLVIGFAFVGSIDAAACGQAVNTLPFEAAARLASLAGIVGRTAWMADRARRGFASPLAELLGTRWLLIEWMPVVGILAALPLFWVLLSDAPSALSSYDNLASSLGGDNFPALKLESDLASTSADARLAFFADRGPVLMLDRRGEHIVIGYYPDRRPASATVTGREPRRISNCGDQIVGATTLPEENLPWVSGSFPDYPGHSASSPEWNTGRVDLEKQWLVTATSGVRAGDGKWSRHVEAGPSDVVTFRLYVHNNSCPADDSPYVTEEQCPSTVAQHAFVRAEFPDRSGAVRVSIHADNAKTATATVTVDLHCDCFLRYLNDSTRFVQHPWNTDTFTPDWNVIKNYWPEADNITDGLDLGDLPGSYVAGRLITFQAIVVPRSPLQPFASAANPADSVPAR